MKTLKILSPILLLIFSTLTSCVPNNGGGTPNNNNRIKKSKSIVIEDNLNIMRVDSAIIDTTILTTYDYGYVQNKLGYYNYKLLVNGQLLPFGKNTYTYQTNRVIEKTYLSANLVTPYSTKYYYFDQTGRLDSVVHQTKTDPLWVGAPIENVVYTSKLIYDMSNRLQEVKQIVNYDDNNIKQRLFDFEYSDGKVLSQKFMIKANSGFSTQTYTGQYFYDYYPETSANQFNISQVYGMGDVYLDGLSKIHLMGLNFGLENNTLLKSSQATSTLPAPIPTINYSYTKDALNRITNKIALNVDTQEEIIYNYTY